MDDAEHHAWGGMRRIAEERPQLLETLLADVRAEGPLTAGELSARHDRHLPKRTGPWWDWSDVKRALEFLFWAGRDHHVPTGAASSGCTTCPSGCSPPRSSRRRRRARAEAQRELLRRSIRSLGRRDGSRPARLLPAPGAGRQGADRRAGRGRRAAAGRGRGLAHAHLPRPAGARCRAGSAAPPCSHPSIPLVWERDRTERLFGFRYRIEIYVPAPKRVHGYYVLPFLLDDALVARVDLKADRAEGALLVQSAWGEPDAPAETAERLGAELRRMADWLGLADVVVKRRGRPGVRARPMGVLEAGRALAWPTATSRSCSPPPLTAGAPVGPRGSVRRGPVARRRRPRAVPELQRGSPNGDAARAGDSAAAQPNPATTKPATRRTRPCCGSASYTHQPAPIPASNRPATTAQADSHRIGAGSAAGGTAKVCQSPPTPGISCRRVVDRCTARWVSSVRPLGLVHVITPSAASDTLHPAWCLRR